MSQYASRGGEKLAAALADFEITPDGWICCDLGSHTGGFVDCLLQNGAGRVHAVDPGYGILAYHLRQNERVVVHERTNALRFVCPEPCQLITIDVGWTPQRLILPTARRGLANGGKIITLVKPQYEADTDVLNDGVVPESAVPEVLGICRADVADEGLLIEAETDSPILGHGGNREYLWLLSSGTS